MEGFEGFKLDITNFYENNIVRDIFKDFFYAILSIFHPGLHCRM